MKKQITALLFALVLCFLAAYPVFAATADGQTANTIPEQRQLARLVDDADLLTDSEEKDLLSELDEISERQQLDVAVVTVYSLDGKSAAAYADDFYDYNGYGYGENDDGIMLLLGMEYSDWAITTYGFGITAFTDAGQEYMAEQFLPNLSSGHYADAFTVYAGLCDDFITQAKTGEPYDTGNLPKTPLSLLWIPIALVIGAVIALFITGIMSSQLKSVRMQAAANSYVKDNSMVITDKRDMFLYSQIHRRKKPKETSSGSSTHTSSSGRSHGGSSGKF